MASSLVKIRDVLFTKSKERRFDGRNRQNDKTTKPEKIKVN